MPLTRLEVDCSTGVITEVELTQAEVDALPIPVVPVPVIPTSVSMRQARLALLQAGFLDQVAAGITNMNKATQIEWEFAANVVRDSPLVIQLSTALSLDAAVLDGLFTLASTL